MIADEIATTAIVVQIKPMTMTATQTDWDP
ncbi:MAG: hypothetical protein QOF14_3067 [Hyphomicrobiales bacterium]|jgi:hypothetical protein|nr:hypothetical protein [Hyphomicrobiales bacterium]